MACDVAESRGWEKLLGTSNFLAHHTKFGIRDMSTVPFTDGRLLPSIPQTPEDKEFASEDLEKGI